MKKIAIIGAGEMAKIVACKAREMRVETHCFAWDQGAVAKDFVDVFYPISIMEKEEILKICMSEQISGVIATTELTIPIVAYIANQMHLNCNDQFVADHITEKMWVRDQLKFAKDMKQPWYIHCTEKEQCRRLDLPGYPVVVKPVSEGGKRGVVVAADQGELMAAMEFAFEADRRNKGIILEEYLSDGCEYSVESISFEGFHQIIQVTEKISSGPPHCVELGHSQPACISEDCREKVVRAVDELLTAVGYQNGPSHTEVKIIDGDVFLIELNGRPGGDHIASPLTWLSTGYDYIGAIIQVAMGEAPPLRDRSVPDKYSGVRFVTVQTKELKDVFDVCDNAEWLYEKHVESDELVEITNNNGFHYNYFIYCSDSLPDFAK